MQGGNNFCMIKKKLILADCDEPYLKELSFYFMEHISQFEVIIFTKLEKIYQYLEQNGTADVLAVDESFAQARLKQLTPNMTRIMLSTGMPPVDGFEPVKKYQRIETLSKTILQKYAEDQNALEAVKGSSDTRVTAFYSPSGGTGKTTLALALAVMGGLMGVRTLFLNLEEIDSVKDLLGKTEGSLSDLFLALKTKGMNVGIKLKGCAGTEPTSGFHYISGVESISEFEEIDEKDMGEFLKMIRELADYDLVIIDLSSGFTGRTRGILKEADTILVPFVVDDGNISKMARLLDESRLHDLYDPLFQKMRLIVNKTGAYGSGIEGVPDSIRCQIPCCASVQLSPELIKTSSILSAGNRIAQVANPIFQTVMENR